MTVPVIDLFAGPGGLGEGFSRAKPFDFEIAVSIEKDGMAFETLQLRAAHRHLAKTGKASRHTWSTWDRIVEHEPWNIVFEKLESSDDPLIAAACAAARREAWNLELGPDTRSRVSEGIRERLKPYMQGSKLPDNSVLIGGPPCQAYSVVGRSRNRGKVGYTAEQDHRHFLYLEYLQVINEFRPAVFIMENVKGILTSRVDDGQIFHRIMKDLQRPDLACGTGKRLEYVLVALPLGSTGPSIPEPSDFIVKAETYGVPQARHRVIICGVRRDVYDAAGQVDKLRHKAGPKVRDIIGDLPRLRPDLSYRGKGKTWIQSLDLDIMDRAIRELRADGRRNSIKVSDTMERLRTRLKKRMDLGTSGADRLRLPSDPQPKKLSSWYRDRSSSLLANHASRSHMPSDLVRYLFVSVYGQKVGESPRLTHFPLSLLPEHKNVVATKVSEAIFKDRFRVQLGTRCSMTITSHIGKDGHAFIHYDPAQCRSLTVREAARLQTFPDSYVFLGARTSQYTQVGNAVPPHLARQIAMIVGKVLAKAGLTGAG